MNEYKEYFDTLSFREPDTIKKSMGASEELDGTPIPASLNIGWKISDQDQEIINETGELLLLFPINLETANKIKEDMENIIAIYQDLSAPKTKSE